MALEITTTTGKIGNYRIRVAGVLNTDTCRQYDLAIAPILGDPLVKSVYLDLSGLAFISSMGLGAILRTRKTIEAKGAAFVAGGMQPQVAKVFQITRLLPREIIFATVEEADAYLATIQQKVLTGEIAPPKET